MMMNFNTDRPQPTRHNVLDAGLKDPYSESLGLGLGPIDPLDPLCSLESRWTKNPASNNVWNKDMPGISIEANLTEMGGGIYLRIKLNADADHADADADHICWALNHGFLYL